MASTLPEGVQLRHRKDCATTTNPQAICSCRPSYLARARAGDGKRVGKAFTKLEDAERWLHYMRGGTTPLPQRGGGITVTQAGRELICGMRDGTILNANGETYKASVIRDYDRDLERTLIPLIGERPLASLRPRDIEDLLAAMQRTGLSPSTARNRIKPLQVIFRRAILHEVVTHSPINAVQLPKAGGYRDNYAPAELVVPMIEAIDEPTVRAAWALLLLTGMRLGEALALKWNDIDHAGGWISITKSYHEATHTTDRPKSRRSVRQIPLAAALQAELGRLVDHRGVEPADALILHGERGLDRPIASQTIRRYGQSAWEERGLPRITPHEARHTWATMMVASGMPIYDIASHLGHSYDETVNRYSHMQPGVIARSAALIDSAVAPAPFAALANDPRDALVTPAAGEASEPDADEVS